jgi:hypothetical protein
MPAIRAIMGCGDILICMLSGLLSRLCMSQDFYSMKTLQRSHDPLFSISWIQHSLDGALQIIE